MDHSTDDGRPAMTPPVAAALRVVNALQQHGFRPALGGSGLLVALGLADVAHDWDLTVDGPVERIATALESAGLAYRDRSDRQGPYASGRRLVLGGPVDLLVNFALRGPDGIEVLPSRVTGQWRGLPLADPVVWARAYRLLGRADKALLLEGLPRPEPV